MKKQNIEMAKKIITEELSYATHSCYYLRENYNNRLSNYVTAPLPENHKLHHLYSIREILSRSIEKIYETRVELHVSEEELGREIDERRTELWQKFRKTERQIEKLETAKKQEETEMKKQNIEEAKKIITEELNYVTHSCYYMEENYNNRLSNYVTAPLPENHKLHHLYSIREILSRSIEKIYETRVELHVSEEELGREIDERRTELWQKFRKTERQIENL